MSGELPRGGAEWMRWVEGQFRTLNRHSHGVSFAEPTGGGGGGGPLGWSIGYNADFTNRQVYTSPDQVICAPDGWTFNAYASPLVPAVAIQSTPGQYGWGYTEPGWYAITMSCNFGITAGVLPLPSFIRLDFASYEGAVIQASLPLFPNSATDLFAQETFTTIYYSPGIAVEVNEQTANQLILGWSGDATLTHSDGGMNNLIELAVVRLDGGTGTSPASSVAWTALQASVSVYAPGPSITIYPNVWSVQAPLAGYPLVALTPDASDFGGLTITDAGIYEIRLTGLLQFSGTYPPVVSARIQADSSYREVRATFPVGPGFESAITNGCWIDCTTGAVPLTAGDHVIFDVFWQGTTVMDNTGMNFDVLVTQLA